MRCRSPARIARRSAPRCPTSCALTGLSLKLHSFPDQLSGGEQQRVSVARAFVNHPPLLLADEPTGNLDPETSIGIMQLLYRINRTGTTVVVATHDSALVDRMRRRVIELDGGRIIRDEIAGGYGGKHPDDGRVRGDDAWRAGPGPARPARRRRRRVRLLTMRFSFFFREAMRSIRRNPIPSFAAAATVLVTLLVLGVFIPIVQAANGAANDVSSRVQLDVFMVKPGDLERQRARAQRDHQHAARQEAPLRQQGPGLQDREPQEPRGLPAARRHEPAARQVRDPARRPEQHRQDRARRCPTTSRSTGSINHQRQTDKIVSGTNALKVAMAILIGLLALASVLLIANTIRLSMFARRREVEVMKLVGATDSFIRWPFLIEGMVLGALGGIGAAFMLLLAKFTILGTLKDEFRHISISHTIPVAELAVILIGASVLVSAIGSGLSLRRFLRV